MFCPVLRRCPGFSEAVPPPLLPVSRVHQPSVLQAQTQDTMASPVLPLERKPACSNHPRKPIRSSLTPRTTKKQGATHIILRRPKDALIACAKYGRDFYQLTAAQVVLALRAYAAQRIQAQWRGCNPRRRFAPKIVALRELVKRERAIREARRRTAFGGWKVGHLARMELMRGTRRPFRRWRAESERLARISALFRGTFWPLYVWRRWANYRVSSRDKVRVVSVPVDRFFFLHPP